MGKRRAQSRVEPMAALRGNPPMRRRAAVRLKPAPSAPPPQKQSLAGASEDPREPESGDAHACQQLQVLQRYRSAAIKSRIKLDNQLAATIARFLGYRGSMSEAERKATFERARRVISSVSSGGAIDPDDAEVAAAADQIILNSKVASNGFQRYITGIEKQMLPLARSLPAAPWVKSVRGFGMKNFAIIVGECGDLSNYPNPAKVWRRMGCAPHEFNGTVRMGQTWRMRGGLPAEEWTAYGYSPHRRSVSHLLADTLLKLNRGEYRARYDEVKATKLALESEEWPLGRCHQHAMLLMAKRALRDLWVAWKAGGSG